MPRHLVTDDPISFLQGYVPMQETPPDPLVSTFWVNTLATPPELMGWDPVDEVWVEVGGGGAAGGGAYGATVGDGVATTFDVQHDLGTTDVLVAVYDLSVTPAEQASTGVLLLDDATVRVVFSVAPGIDEARVVVGAGGGGGGGGAVLSPGDVPPATAHPSDDEFDAATIDPAWTLANQGAGSAFTATGAGVESSIGNDSTQMRPMVRAVPSGDFRFTIALHELFHLGADLSGLSMVVLNAAQTAANVTTLWGYDNGSHHRWYMNRQEYSPLSSRTVHAGLEPAQVPAAPLYLQTDCYLDGATWRRTLRWSRTGQAWSPDVDAGRAIGFEPAFMGWSGYDRNGSGSKALVRWFRVEDL